MPNFVILTAYENRKKFVLAKDKVITIEDVSTERLPKRVMIQTVNSNLIVSNPYKTIEEFVNLFEPDQRDI